MAEPQTLLADRYRLVRLVGSGGMGVVWEARDERLERPVAVKQLRPQLGLTPEEAELAKSRALREARITARLHHRHAVPVFDVVEHEGQPCLIMQFVPSVPLSGRLRESGPLGVQEAGRIGAEVASALAAAHQLGIVHRDVKPGNILLSDDGTAMLSDFGISHALGDVTLTATGLLHGTLAYLAPEVARGATASSASDVFSLGATLFAALEGKPPFGTDSNSIALLHRVASGDFVPPLHAGSLRPVLVEMLRSDPDDRPSMRHVAARLAAGGTVTSGAGAPPTVPQPEPLAAREEAWTTQVRQRRVPTAPLVEPSVAGPAPKLPSTSRRRRRPWVPLVLLVVALVVGSVLAVGQLTGREAGVAADPATSDTSPSSRPSDAPTARDGSSAAPSSASSTQEASPSSTATSTSPSPSPTSGSSGPTAAELEDAITRYYALVPDDTDGAWPLLTAQYQRTTSGGRESYEQFWGRVDSVSVDRVDATAPSRVDATVTYRRGSEQSVERTSFRLVREDGVLKISSSTVLSGS